jgi:hypothetical protein
MEPSGKGSGDAARRVILPFAGREAGPLERWRLPFVVRGVAIQFQWERWRDADAASCPERDRLIADPRCPGESGIVRLEDILTGELSYALLPGEAEGTGPGPAGAGRRVRRRPRSR